MLNSIDNICAGRGDNPLARSRRATTNERKRDILITVISICDDDYDNDNDDDDDHGDSMV